MTISEKFSSEPATSILGQLEEMIEIGMRMDLEALRDMPCERCAAGMPCYFHRPLHGSAPR